MPQLQSINDLRKEVPVTFPHNEYTPVGQHSHEHSVAVLADHGLHPLAMEIRPSRMSGVPSVRIARIVKQNNNVVSSLISKALGRCAEP